MFEDNPNEHHHSANRECAICFEEHAVTMMYFGICEKQVPFSAYGRTDAVDQGSSGATICMVCYPDLFDGLHFQFMNNRLPYCVACNAPLHQTTFNGILRTLEENCSSSLGERKLNNKLCTCSIFSTIMCAGFDSPHSESISCHAKECSFDIIKRMCNQV